ncbi:MAG TPA: polysaccharide biosynthesis/export family protein, partial [Gemmatales bacterium]|nr:polysaccharide biosynthesis/export family protein [Gemmatales bacterium]
MQKFIVVMLVGSAAWVTGCASLSNPTANAIPVNRVPPEILGESREIEQTIPEKFLKAPKQEPYLLGPNDVLGIYIKNVTGGEKDIPPILQSYDPKLPPSFGYPFAVREDGTVSLPLALEPIKVAGMSLTEAEKEIKRYYVDVWNILKPENASVSVTIQKQRTNAIYVLRQDSGAVTFGGGGLNNTKRGTGIVLNLQYNESDVATALASSGGLPGLDAKNEVLIFRGAVKADRDGQLVMPDLKKIRVGKTVLTRDEDGTPGLEVVRI